MLILYNRYIHWHVPKNYCAYVEQIDVENPCVIMSQDKSREFLHSGNAKDKFKVRKMQFDYQFLLCLLLVTDALFVLFF